MSGHKGAVLELDSPEYFSAAPLMITASQGSCSEQECITKGKIFQLAMRAREGNVCRYKVAVVVHLG